MSSRKEAKAHDQRVQRAQREADIVRREYELGMRKDPPPKTVIVDGHKIPVASRPDPGQRSP